jgi:hypothetical protein
MFQDVDYMNTSYHNENAIWGVENIFLNLCHVLFATFSQVNMSCFTSALGRSSRLTLALMFILLVKFYYKVKLKLKNLLSDFGGFQSLEVREKIK